ncbi:hypothetical protein PQR65_36935 [Paraburkholderia nemoris]|uniref:hypothetical protein n=1 Tax=Paraburkholderia nemoris TaxID=2793076 RepID=UPI0038B9EC0E
MSVVILVNTVRMLRNAAELKHPQRAAPDVMAKAVIVCKEDKQLSLNLTIAVDLSRSGGVTLLKS